MAIFVIYVIVKAPSKFWRISAWLALLPALGIIGLTFLGYFLQKPGGSVNDVRTIGKHRLETHYYWKFNQAGSNELWQIFPLLPGLEFYRIIAKDVSRMKSLSDDYIEIEVDNYGIKEIQKFRL